MRHDQDWATAQAMLRAAALLVDGVQAGVAARGFVDVRPTHGFAFARIAAGDATVVDLAGFLGISKQAASQLVAQLTDRGYVERVPDPRDGRARLLLLTERGTACTRAATDGATETLAGWRAQLGEQDFAVLARALDRLALPGPLRPAW